MAGFLRPCFVRLSTGYAAADRLAQFRLPTVLSPVASAEAKGEALAKVGSDFVQQPQPFCFASFAELAYSMQAFGFGCINWNPQIQSFA